MKLPVNEIFATWQGEGVHMGRAAFFIRLHGCPLHCPWCDSAGTWHPSYVPDKIQRIESEELANAARESDAQFVVITGGEPAIHDLREITSILQAGRDNDTLTRIMPVHLETSGAFPIKGDFAFVTVSPKRAKMPLKENLLLASELKMIIDSVESIDEWDRYLQDNYFPNAKPNWNVWLHPEWSQRQNKEILEGISKQVKKYPGLYRAGYQMHKLYQVDSLDKRTRPLAPLGGNLELGY
jgi:organic radical activating enzyme